MIVYNLKCKKEHVFEAWFPDSAAYDEQAAAGKVVCPDCGSRKISKAPMAPNLSTSRELSSSEERSQAKAAMEALRAMRAEIEKNAEHVGPKFAEEARKIHYKEVKARPIYGEATKEEAAEMVEEGVEFGTVPWVPRGDA